jgi:carboxylesterase type B
MHSMKQVICLLLAVMTSVAEAHAQSVVFWIHGGGWQTGDKTMVALKPKAFTDAGFVFVSISHRLLPGVDMGAITRDGETTHASINDNLGAPNDPVTKALFAFVADALKR